ncbi:amidohydrolase [Paraburkholderia bryophila]|uniref:Hippurate hydrolase n=1 Tax=Paraburkholderia bryophila TaxID=420952 RepID=A0A7Z0BB20_9BURK|nr:amidohydrolase [Paraburkholderia bryophila]NYH25972.1 hippurate hydrolase [Paraburkholderia bryophila]
MMKAELEIDNLVQVRRHVCGGLGVAPEEHRTAAAVAARLKELGVDVYTGIGETGVVGVIEGRSNSSGLRIGLRADMDALQISDHQDVAHHFLCEGRMHGRGQDVHTAILLGAAEVFVDSRNFDGTLILIFQPADEGSYGAKAMLEDGLLERFPVDSFWGLHAWPGLQLGTAAVHSGECMAAVDYFDIDVIGKGCHGGMPQEGVDSILAASHLVTALQSIPTRNVHPRDSAVVGVAKIHGGYEYHVHPERVTVSGSVRAHKESVLEVLELRVRELSRSVAAAFGATVDIRYQRNYPPTINDLELARIAAKVAETVVGEGNVFQSMLPSMAAEDFSYFVRERPGCYVWLGSDEGGASHQRQHPKHETNDQLVDLGVSYWVELVRKLLPI